jgi:micrococcal nuclease
MKQALCALLALAACSTGAVVVPEVTTSPMPSVAVTPPAEIATVERVVDGDTVVVRVGGARVRVRLIGVDTPEVVRLGTPVGCFGPEASAHLKRLLPPGTEVRLTYDLDRADRYGRTLAYLYVGALFVNLDLVARGYATVLTIPPNVAHTDELVAAQRSARARSLGLWGACIGRD